MAGIHRAVATKQVLPFTDRGSTRVHLGAKTMVAACSMDLRQQVASGLPDSRPSTNAAQCMSGTLLLLPRHEHGDACPLETDKAHLQSTLPPGNCYDRDCSGHVSLLSLQCPRKQQLTTGVLSRMILRAIAPRLGAPICIHDAEQ